MLSDLSSQTARSARALSETMVAITIHTARSPDPNPTGNVGPARRVLRITWRKWGGFRFGGSPGRSSSPENTHGSSGYLPVMASALPDRALARIKSRSSRAEVALCKIINRIDHDFGRGMVGHVSNVLEQDKPCAWQYRGERTGVGFR